MGILAFVDLKYTYVMAEGRRGDCMCICLCVSVCFSLFLGSCVDLCVHVCIHLCINLFLCVFYVLVCLYGTLFVFPWLLLYL